MGDLHVTVRFNDYIVEDRVMPVRDVVRIGDSGDARVPFPGASVSICRVGETLDIRGRRLAAGERTGFSLGNVHVELEHLIPLQVRRSGPVPLDLRFLLVALAVTTGGMWVDSGLALLDDPGEGPLASYVQRARELLPLQSPAPRSERTAAVKPNTELALTTESTVRGEGREASDDDHLTGVQYYRWYRLEVPSTLEAELARLRLEQDPQQLRLHALVAQGAYDNDDWGEALAHYQALSEAEPDNVQWLYGLSQAQKRLGWHRMELETYERILELEPGHVFALANGAVALARVGDYESSDEWLLRLHRQERADHPYLAVYEAQIAAIQGREAESVRLLEAAVLHRGELSDLQRLELRRDVAVDPALSSLRTGRSMRRMLWKHYGAAAPRKNRR